MASIGRKLSNWSLHRRDKTSQPDLRQKKRSRASLRSLYTGSSRGASEFASTPGSTPPISRQPTEVQQAEVYPRSQGRFCEHEVILSQRQEDFHYDPDGTNEGRRPSSRFRIREKAKAYWTVIKLKAKFTKL